VESSAVNRRDLAVIAFKSMALWFAASGLIGVAGTLLAWPRGQGPFEVQGAWLALAQAALSLPTAAIIWLASDYLAQRIFPETALSPSSLNRADLWSTATLCIGLFLLSQAVPQLLYWVVVWRSAGGTTFWSHTADWRDDAGVAYRLAFRGQLAETLTRLVLGIAFIAGPDRIRGLAGRVRKEAFGHTLVDEAPPGESAER
jgi:hypothetical protein